MIDFSAVEKQVKTLNAQFLVGEFDVETFEARLMDLIDLAADGHYWMFGHESNQWFRHDGRAWQPEDPDQISTIQAETGGGSEAGRPSWNSIELGWFVTSLVILIAIGGVVYTSV